LKRIFHFCSNSKYSSGTKGTWEGKCKFNKANKASIGYAPILGFVKSPTGTEEWLQNAIATKGPIAVAINVVSSFVSYSTGVYFDSDCTKKNKNYVGSHAIVAIGYGTDAALGDYWLMRNSWGDKWGEQGNIRMARNKGNLCDLAKFAIYPRV